MNPFGFDPDWWPLEAWPWWLRWFKRAWMYAAPRVTGHAAHALNGILVWLPVSWLIPLAWYWPLPVVFYTAREVLGIIRWDRDALDHIGDIVWVYAIGVALWCPWWVLVGWFPFVVLTEVLYYMGPAPGWMPRESLLWGDR